MLCAKHSPTMSAYLGSSPLHPNNL